MTNQEIAKILYEMSALYEMEGVEFKPRAYEKAAMSIESLGTPAAELYKKRGLKGLDEIPSVGAAIARHIESLLRRGTFSEYKRLKKKVPVKIGEIQAIEGVGPKMIKALYRELGVKNLKDLEKAAKSHKVCQLFRFGEKVEQNILRGIEFQKRSEGRFLLGYILPTAQKIEDLLRRVPGVKQVAVAGSIRRRKETIGDIDILATTSKPREIMDAFVSLSEVQTVYAKGKTKSAVRLKIGLDADLRAVSDESFGSALQYFTGNKDHNIAVRKIAIVKNLKLNEYGLFKGKKRVAGKTEKEIYSYLGMDLPPPEIRTNTGEIEAALKHKLPKLIPYGSIQGDLQVTTNTTDGAASIEEMALEAKRLGLKYIAPADHTRSLAMAHGLSEAGLLKQAKEIERLNKKIKNFKILKGAEVNILYDGSLDIKNFALAKLDVVCAAVHTNFKMPKSQMTARIIKAMKNPYVNVLFHPTGRIIRRREEYQVDIDALIKAAKEYGVALEIDAFPDRLDLRDVHVRKAVEAGAKLVINTDAHALHHLGYLDLGVAVARRGWARKSDVLNTKSWPELLKTFKLLKKKKK